jgi:VWFA-related protein
VRLLTFGLAAATFCGLSAVSAGQSNSQVQTFRTSTRLVQVSVVVHDDRNQPVEGLRAEDFRVFEDGKELPVALFARRAQDPARAVPVTADSGTFTNRIPSPANGGVVAIVFDQLNTLPMDQAHARENLLRYLESIRPDDRVALYLLTGDGVKVLYDFTRDAESLVKALRTVQPRDLAIRQDVLSDALARDLDAFARGVLRDEGIYFDRLRTDTTLAALEGIAFRLAGLPGRKNVVWISAGFPFIEYSPTGPSSAYFTPETRRATRALNHSDTAIYPVDARGLVVMSATAKGQVATLRNVEDPIAGLRKVADWTGGKLFYNSNDVGPALARAADDSRLTYTLGYYPVNDNWDSKFRRITVKVRRPDTHVRHRAGYFAYPVVPADPPTLQKALSDALKSPLEGSGVLMNVTARAAGPKITLAIELDPTTFTLVDDAGAWKGRLDVAIAQTLSGERQQREPDFSLPLSVTAAERDRLMRQGLRLTRSVELQPNVQQLRIVVRDAATGMVGSVFIDAARLKKAAEYRSTVPTDR